jgi:tRNA G37 N-methylase Trm5
MQFVERVFGDNNKQGIVVSSSAAYESMQVLLSEHCKKNVVSSFSPAVLHCAVDSVFVRCYTCL